MRNHWLTIWLHPRATMRSIFARGANAGEIALLMFIGIFLNLIVRAMEQSLGDTLSLPMILLMAVGVSIIGGIAVYFIGGGLLTWSGCRLGGIGSYREVRLAIAYSQIPSVALLLLFVLQYVLFGEDLFHTYTPRIDAAPLAVKLSFYILQLVLAFWSFIIFVKCLGEAHDISAAKAFMATLLPGLIITLVIVVLFFIHTLLSI